MKATALPTSRFAMIFDPDGNKIMIHKRNVWWEVGARRLTRYCDKSQEKKVCQRTNTGEWFKPVEPLLQSAEVYKQGCKVN
jgi:hypothetical protein